MNKYYLLIIIFITLTGCYSTVPLTSPESDKESKIFSPPADMSYIYILRDNWGAHHFIEVNGKSIGDLSNETYFLLKVQPGEYKIKVGLQLSAEAKKKLGAANIDIFTEPGHMYFLRIQTPSTGFGIPAILTVLPIGEGKKYVLKFKRAKYNFN